MTAERANRRFRGRLVADLEHRACIASARVHEASLTVPPTIRGARIARSGLPRRGDPEEFVVVLRGCPTLRTPDGERALEEGEVVFFPRGPNGAHQLVNRSAEAVRVLFVSQLACAEVAEYPDSGKVRVVTREASQRGERLVLSFRLEDDVDYFEGELA